MSKLDSAESMTLELEDKVALIVGGTGAIGAASAIAFAKHGCKLVIAGRNKEAADSVLASVTNAGSEGVFIHCDLTDPVSAENLGKQSIAAFGGIDIAFNNAGWEGVPALTADIDETN